MDDLTQWSISLVIGISIATFLAWFKKSDSDFKDGFEPKRNDMKGKKSRHAKKDIKLNEIQNNSK